MSESGRILGVNSAAAATSSKATWTDRRVAFLLIVTCLGILVLLNWPFLSTYAVKDDDTPLLYHSVRNFAPSAMEWVKDGFSEYFRNYPEQRDLSVDVIRPGHNAIIYAQSWLISDPHSVWFALANYIGHAVVVGLVFLVGRRVFRLPRLGSLLAAILFFGTVSTGERPPQGSLEYSVAYSSDMLGCLFALVALLVAHSWIAGPRRRWKPVATVVLLVIAVFTKETALAAPMVVAIAIIGERLRVGGDGRLGSRLRRAAAVDAKLLAALAVPLLLYLVAYRHADAGGGYVFKQMLNSFHGVPLIVLNPVAFIFLTFFPVELGTIDAIVTGRDLEFPAVRFAISSGRAMAAVAVNLLAWGAVVQVVRRARDRGWLVLMLLMGLAAYATPIFISAHARYMYYGQALMLPFLITILHRLTDSPVSRRVLRRPTRGMAIGLLIVVGPVYYVVRTLLSQGEQVALNREAATLRAVVEEQLADPQLKRLYLLNAHGQNGLPELSLLAAEGGRDDVALRVVNTVGGLAVTEAEEAGTSFTARGKTLGIRVRIGPGQVLFGGDIAITRENLDRLAGSTALRYGEMGQLAAGSVGGNLYLTQRVIEFSIPGADRLDYVVLGFDPAAPGVHVYKPATNEWRPAGAPLRH